MTNSSLLMHLVLRQSSRRPELYARAKAALHADDLETVADRGYFKGEEILDCEAAGITLTLPKPQTSGAESDGRFGKQDFVYRATEEDYICPVGEKLKDYFTAEENGQQLRNYWNNARRACSLKTPCTKRTPRRIKRLEHEAVVEALQTRLDKNAQAMRVRRETAEASEPVGQQAGAGCDVGHRVIAHRFLREPWLERATESLP